ncbi:MAG TPA: hypothetical protein RMH85_17340 [Polyangiaceae bacterium LLY-WYZ-15_(1-7)]|nr:hypothetical protein [Sandaracinus sp.]MBJ71439.1 hypothetical protein [Sandaracinus sp.]HJL02054.1 hypothetical protein [Polyangiaceae bacterium LLY-WYZ-15_(1-7)]HJL10267.1 hypothetical protein [Polyangiaceae bacterium LLY-WYZ-15_(1-7)]HJL24219.1 hypothetical protein [Polyangiaceae bacterium LLY-WYZ-15_(1-7)]
MKAAREILAERVGPTRAAEAAERVSRRVLRVRVVEVLEEDAERAPRVADLTDGGPLEALLEGRPLTPLLGLGTPDEDALPPPFRGRVVEQVRRWEREGGEKVRVALTFFSEHVVLYVWPDGARALVGEKELLARWRRTPPMRARLGALLAAALAFAPFVAFAPDGGLAARGLGLGAAALVALFAHAQLRRRRFPSDAPSKLRRRVSR